MTNLPNLIERLESAKGPDNVLDVLVEVAMFNPNGVPFSACRANAAGTKVIYTDRAGNNVTSWAEPWSEEPRRTTAIAALRAREADRG